MFVATKVACDVQLQVGIAGSNVPAWTHSPTRTRALGRSLHVTICHLIMPASERLQPGVLYEYNVNIARIDTGAEETLNDQPLLLRGTEPLGYAEGALPTFAVPPGIAALNVLHASCRKPHGGGQDALKMADQLIVRSRTASSPAERALARPHHLLLTGDQIYSDDVAIAMLHTLHEAAAELCATSVEERFPGTSIGMLSPQVKPGLARKEFLRINTKLTSDHGMNHLVFFAEFCAMYVLCWSDALWLRDTDGVLQLGDTPFDISFDVIKQNRQERKDVRLFLRTLRRVRRVLANVPTMMMFDDHEISDDWNLDGGWFDNARSDPGLQRIVRNGLLAFAVFQAWGNDPARFNSGVPKDLLDAVTVPSDDVRPIILSPALVNVALDLTAAVGNRMTWNWMMDGPEHRVVALDTRTRRDYASLGPDSPGLLTPAELQRQLIANRPPANSGRLSFVIAPAPVVGHPLVEQILQPALALQKGARAADNEAWCVNRSIYQALLRALADFGRVIVLSGDVHYAYTNHTAYFSGNGQPRGRIVQLCSSASKNADGMTRAIQTAGYLGSEGEDWLGFAAELTLSERAMLLAALGSELITLKIKIFKLFETPAVVPAGPWGASSAFTEVKRRADRLDPNDWRYRVRFVRDTRNGGGRLTTALQIEPHPRPVLQVIEQAHKSVVGEPNLGQVFVRVQNGVPTSVEHRLHWMTTDDPSFGAQTCTVHIAPLHMPAAAEFPEPTP